MRDMPITLIVAAISFILLMTVGPANIMFYHLATIFAVSMFILVLSSFQEYYKTKPAKAKGERHNG